MTHLPLAIDPAHPAFAGHFPSMPIVPGVVLLDHGLRAIATHRAATAATATTGRADVERCSIGTAKFLSFVRPGEPVRLELEPSGDDATTNAAFRLRIFAGTAGTERLAVTGSVAFERARATSRGDGASG